MDSKKFAKLFRNGNADAALRAACWNDPVWVTYRLLHGSPYDVDIYNTGPRSAPAVETNALENAARPTAAPVSDWDDPVRAAWRLTHGAEFVRTFEPVIPGTVARAEQSNALENAEIISAASDDPWGDPKEAVRRLCGGSSKWDALFVGTDPLAELERAAELDRLWRQAMEADWDPAKHPRDETGRFTETSAGGVRAHSPAAASSVKFQTVGAKKTVQGRGDKIPAPAAKGPKPGAINPGHRTPTTGKWKGGVRGVGEWIPDEPIDIPGGTVKSVPYDQNGSPILDKWSKGEVNIVLSGDRDVDEANAKKAFGKKLDENYTFHHDPRSMKIVKIDGKEVVIGRMQIVPFELNKQAKHVGSYSAAKKFYNEAKLSEKERIALANKANAQLGNKSSAIAKAAKNMPNGKIDKSLLNHLGKTIKRVLPVVGTGLALLSFADDVEAHGVAGAVARATPVLGDIIALHDLTKEVGDQIVAGANQQADEDLKKLNDKPAKAQEIADAKTAELFNQVAADITVTNPDLNMDEIADAVKEFREDVANATLVELERQRRVTTDRLRDDPKLTPYQNRLNQATARLRKRLQAEASKKPAADT